MKKGGPPGGAPGKGYANGPILFYFPPIDGIQSIGLVRRNDLLLPLPEEALRKAGLP